MNKYDNYIPNHLDDPKYVGNFEVKKVGIILFSGIFSLMWIVSGSYLAAALLVLLTGAYFKLEKDYGDYLPGLLYWTIGFVPFAGKSKEKAEKFGLVPTYIKDFEE